MAVKVNESENALLKSTQQQTVGEYLRGYFRQIRSGDIGALPIIFGMIVIAIIFQTANQNFLTPKNLVNLIAQMAGITAIGYGVVYVLLLGEIDLSVGYVSGVAAVSMTLALKGPLPDYMAAGIGFFFALAVCYFVWYAVLSRFKMTRLAKIVVCLLVMILLMLVTFKLMTGGALPWFIAVPLALIAAAGIGLLHGMIITYFGLPAFVVTLAGLLAWNGVVLIFIGGAGTVILQDTVVRGLANSYFKPELGWLIGLGIVDAFALTQVQTYNSRRKYGLSSKPMGVILLQVIGLALITAIIVHIANQDRGLPFIGLALILLMVGLSFLATRTKFGRYVFAVGGNAEAARRAGVNVRQIRVRVFMISSFMAGVGGIILASRLGSVATDAGGGQTLLNSIAAAVIGGTSLFGGSGKVSSAIMGAIIVASVENGMGLIPNVGSGPKFIVTALVLLAAVIVDALARRSQKQSGLR